MIAWPSHCTHTTRSRYATLPTLNALVILCCLASPCHWSDLSPLFGRRLSHLSEKLWKGLVLFLNKRGHLIERDMSPTFVATRLQLHSDTIHRKCGTSDPYLGFIDGTVLEIARPNNRAKQNSTYNGHKRKQALKLQTVTNPDGLILHDYGLMTGSYHDWALVNVSEMDWQM